MIVKNESHVIEKCLHSVKDIIDYWVIVDTGSNDGTQEIIRHFLQDIPGELHERPWINFGHNRQEALELAQNKADYILFIDADEEFVYETPFDKTTLTKDGYSFIIRNDLSQYHRLLLIKSSIDWHWEGIIHEDLHCNIPVEISLFEGVICLSHVNGSRSLDPQKYYKDIALLEEDLKKNPDNPRSIFYIAQSYSNIPDYENALKYFKKRAQMGGWDQEIYYSLQSIGKLEALLGQPSDQVLKSLADAFCYNPKRAEPLYYITQLFMKNENYLLAYFISQHTIKIPLCQENIYVEQWIYSWGALLQHAECCFRLQKFEESLAAIDQLLQKNRLPNDVRASLQNNQQLILAHLQIQ